MIQQALCYPPEGLVQHLDLHDFMRVGLATVCCSRGPSIAAKRGGRGPGAKLAAARSGGPAGAALALPGPHPGALSIPGLL